MSGTRSAGGRTGIVSADRNRIPESGLSDPEWDRKVKVDESGCLARSVRSSGRRDSQSGRVGRGMVPLIFVGTVRAKSVFIEVGPVLTALIG